MPIPTRTPIHIKGKECLSSFGLPVALERKSLLIRTSDKPQITYIMMKIGGRVFQVAVT